MSSYIINALSGLLGVIVTLIVTWYKFRKEQKINRYLDFVKEMDRIFYYGDHLKKATARDTLSRR